MLPVIQSARSRLRKLSSNNSRNECEDYSDFFCGLIIGDDQFLECVSHVNSTEIRELCPKTCNICSDTSSNSSDSTTPPSILSSFSSNRTAFDNALDISVRSDTGDMPAVYSKNASLKNDVIMAFFAFLVTLGFGFFVIVLVFRTRISRAIKEENLGSAVYSSSYDRDSFSTSSRSHNSSSLSSKTEACNEVENVSMKKESFFIKEAVNATSQASENTITSIHGKFATHSNELRNTVSENSEGNKEKSSENAPDIINVEEDVPKTLMGGMLQIHNLFVDKMNPVKYIHNLQESFSCNESNNSLFLKKQLSCTPIKDSIQIENEAESIEIELGEYAKKLKSKQNRKNISQETSERKINPVLDKSNYFLNTNQSFINENSPRSNKNIAKGLRLNDYKREKSGECRTTKDTPIRSSAPNLAPNVQTFEKIVRKMSLVKNSHSDYTSFDPNSKSLNPIPSYDTQNIEKNKDNSYEFPRRIRSMNIFNEANLPPLDMHVLRSRSMQVADLEKAEKPNVGSEEICNLKISPIYSSKQNRYTSQKSVNLRGSDLSVKTRSNQHNVPFELKDVITKPSSKDIPISPSFNDGNQKRGILLDEMERRDNFFSEKKNSNTTDKASLKLNNLRPILVKRMPSLLEKELNSLGKKSSTPKKEGNKLQKNNKTLEKSYGQLIQKNSIPSKRNNTLVQKNSASLQKSGSIKQRKERLLHTKDSSPERNIRTLQRNSSPFLHNNGSPLQRKDILVQRNGTSMKKKSSSIQNKSSPPQRKDRSFRRKSSVMKEEVNIPEQGNQRCQDQRVRSMADMYTTLELSEDIALDSSVPRRAVSSNLSGKDQYIAGKVSPKLNKLKGILTDKGEEGHACKYGTPQYGTPQYFNDEKFTKIHTLKDLEKETNRRTDKVKNSSKP